MTEENKTGSAGGHDSTSGNDGDNNKKPDGDWVSYDTHRKLLSEKKKAGDRIADLEKRLADIDAKAKEDEEKALQDKEEWKKLHDLKVKELIDAQGKLKSWETRETESRKLSAFLDHLPGAISKDYWGLIPTEKIVINPDTGEIDQTSVTELVADFAKKHTRLIDKPGSGTDGLPKNSPKGGDANVSYDQWKNMSAADMRKNMRAVMAAEGDS